jgi:hypothetical protein
MVPLYHRRSENRTWTRRPTSPLLLLLLRMRLPLLLLLLLMSLPLPLVVAVAGGSLAASRCVRQWL